MTGSGGGAKYKDLLKLLNYGVYVIGAKVGENLEFTTCAWLMQGSYEAGEIIANVGIDHFILRLIKESRKFTVSILGVDNLDLAQACALSGEEKSTAIEGLGYAFTSNEAPYLPQSLGWLECAYEKSFELRAGELVVGLPEAGKMLRKGEPLTLSEYNRLVRV